MHATNTATVQLSPAPAIGQDARWQAMKAIWAGDEEMTELLERVEQVIAPTFSGNPVEAIKAIVCWGASVDEQSHIDGSAGALADFRAIGLPPVEDYTSFSRRQ